MEHQDFAHDEHASFRRIMTAEAKLLLNKGHKSYEKKDCTLAFLTADIELCISSIHEDWDLRLQARLKTIAVSVNALPRLPWERICFGDDAPLPGVTETVKVPDGLLAAAINAREAANSVLHEWRLFAAMRDVLRQTDTTQALLEVERAFVLEIHFLLVVAEPMCESHVRREVLAAFPTEDKAVTIDACIDLVRKVKHSTMVLACKPALHKEIESVLSFLANLLDFVPPIMSKFAAISSFFAKVLSQAEHFLRLDTETVTTECGVFVKQRNTVTGRAAIAH